jgi:hypothetical protein
VSTSSPTTHRTRITLANGTPVEVRVVFGAEHEPDALPMTSLPGEILLAVDGDVADAAAVGQAILDLLHAGEAAQRESAASAARLAETVAEVEAARSVGRTDW